MENLQTTLVRPFSLRLDLLTLMVAEALAIALFLWGWPVFWPVIISAGFGILLEGIYLSRRYTEFRWIMTPWGCTRFFEPLHYTGSPTLIFVGSGPRVIFFDREIRDWTAVLRKSASWEFEFFGGEDVETLIISYDQSSLPAVLRTCQAYGLPVLSSGYISESHLREFITGKAKIAHDADGRPGVRKLCKSLGFEVGFVEGEVVYG